MLSPSLEALRKKAETQHNCAVTVNKTTVLNILSLLDKAHEALKQIQEEGNLLALCDDANAALIGRSFANRAQQVCKEMEES